MSALTGREFLDMRVIDVRGVPEHPNPDACIVLLAERDGDGRLPIWIGRAEATIIALRLEQVELARPGAYDLTVAVLRGLGGRLREVRIDRLRDGTYYATVVVDGREGPVEVDARPSDALNLALAAGAPVRVDPGVAEEGTAHPAARRALEQWAGEERAGARALLEELFRPPPGLSRPEG